MLNSFNNNPGNGNAGGFAQNQNAQNSGEQGETIIKEVYEDEPDDYNFKPQLHEVDEEEIRNLSAIQHSDTVDKRIYYVAAAFTIAAIIGWVIGFIAAGASASSADESRKSTIAKSISTTYDKKVEGMDRFAQVVSSVADGKYSETSFKKIAEYGNYDFMLDISSEISSEAILLANQTVSNPLQKLRTYSAKTLLLRQLLSVHVNETHAESEAILELQSEGNAAKVVYAMQILPNAVYNLMTTAPRTQYANGIVNIYTYKNVIEDDNEASAAYSVLKSENNWSEAMLDMRNYKPTKAEEKRIADENLDLPSRLMYQVIDKNGRQSTLFADDIVLVDRTLLFGKSANALERYKQRTERIRNTISEIQSIGSGLSDDLKKFIID